MNDKPLEIVGIALSGDIEHRPNRPTPYRARVRWTDPTTKERRSRSEAFANADAARNWIDRLRGLAQAGVHPDTATMPLTEYGETAMQLAMRGLEPKTLDPYKAGWRLRVVPTLGHIAPSMITNDAVDRAVDIWIADGCGLSTIKNSLAALVRIMEQAKRDGIIERNPARVTRWQHAFESAHDELDNPRALALPDWATLTALADALVARSADRYRGWGDVVIYNACTGARIGEGVGLSSSRHQHDQVDLDGPQADHPIPGWAGRQRDQRKPRP